MNLRLILEWLLLAATAGLLVLIKILHMGVTHYNLFLLILIGWCLGLILIFRLLASWDRSRGTGSS